MDKLAFYHIDTFTDKIFSGNPAGVCVLPSWIAEDHLHKIAQENNLPVTAFLVEEGERFSIRWITPEYELDICGHGTLAAAYVIFHYLRPTLTEVQLKSQSDLFTVTRYQDLITLNFPAKSHEPFFAEILQEGLGISPLEMYQRKNERCFAVLENEMQVEQLKPNIEILKQLPHRAVVVTAVGNHVDFVSRTFYPNKKTMTEDAVTGASHCLLVPYWAKRLNKNNLHALQRSERGGEIFCKLEGERVLISGKAILYAQGSIC
jgi:PhzF family phenazine biosynthesis protein